MAVLRCENLLNLLALFRTSPSPVVVWCGTSRAWRRRGRPPGPAAARNVPHLSNFIAHQRQPQSLVSAARAEAERGGAPPCLPLAPLQVAYPTIRDRGGGDHQLSWHGCQVFQVIGLVNVEQHTGDDLVARRIIGDVRSTVSVMEISSNGSALPSKTSSGSTYRRSPPSIISMVSNRQRCDVCSGVGGRRCIGHDSPESKVLACARRCRDPEGSGAQSMRRAGWPWLGDRVSPRLRAEHEPVRSLGRRAQMGWAVVASAVLCARMRMDAPARTTLAS